ncbi:hypothetical protein DdX_09125 [Ditylenchus destructor]|uniref:Uncharacterized protein n=1 Tax=Ditylenchus destructor TaxID=166010 RepID=A0AAD4N400_9BILA|nr:hypothetical protein DdX_09125 [Ditylenchus destructor]
MMQGSAMIYLLAVLAILNGFAVCPRGMNGMNEMNGMNGRNGMQGRRNNGTGGLTHGVSGHLARVGSEVKAGIGEFEDWETIHSLCQNAANPMMANMAGKQGRMGKAGQMGGQMGQEGGMNQRGMNQQMGGPGQMPNANTAAMFHTIVTYFYLGDGENNPMVRHLSNIQYEHGNNAKFFKIHVHHDMKPDFHRIFGADAKFPLIAICRDGAITEKVNEGSIIEMFLRSMFMT